MRSIKTVVSVAAMIAVGVCYARCNPSRKWIVGSYTAVGANGSGKLTLKSDGSLEEVLLTGGQEKLLKGSWTLSGNELSRTPCWHLPSDETFGEKTSLCISTIVVNVLGNHYISIDEDIGLSYDRDR